MQPITETMVVGKTSCVCTSCACDFMWNLYLCDVCQNNFCLYPVVDVVVCILLESIFVETIAMLAKISLESEFALFWAMDWAWIYL